jgi:N-acetylneuraminic acid mutarotase
LDDTRPHADRARGLRGRDGERKDLRDRRKQGHLGKLAAVEEYDPATDTWRSRTPMPIRKRAAFAAAEIGGKIYIAGGVDDVDDVADNLDVYHPASDSWVARTPMPAEVFGLSGAAVGGRMYAFTGFVGAGFQLNGATLEYDPAGDVWNTRAPLPTPRVSYAAVAVGGEIYVIGGISVNSFQTVPIASVEEYTPPH